MSNQPIKNQEYSFYIFLVSQSTGQFKSTPTIAAGDFKRSIDGASYFNFTNLPTVDPGGSKSVKITFTAAEMNCSNLVWLASDAAGAEWDDVGGNIQPISWLDTSDRVDVGKVAGTAQTAGDIIADTNNIQTRLPAALSGDGFMKADLKSIDDEFTSGNNATLNLKKLNIVNNAGDAFVARSSGGNGTGMNVMGNGFGFGLSVVGGNDFAEAAQFLGKIRGIVISADEPTGGTALEIINYGSGKGVQIISNDDDALLISSGTGKSINAPQDIALPSGDLDDQLQTIDNLIDTEVAAIKSKTDQLTFTNTNQVDANIQAVNDTNIIGDGSGTPWGPA